MRKGGRRRALNTMQTNPAGRRAITVTSIAGMRTSVSDCLLPEHPGLTADNVIGPPKANHGRCVTVVVAGAFSDACSSGWLICSKRDRRSSIWAGGTYFPSLGYLLQVLSRLSPPAGRTSDLPRPCSLLLRPDVPPAPVHHASQARERLVLAVRNAESSRRSMTM